MTTPAGPPAGPPAGTELPPSGQRTTRVAVCVATLARPHGLARLLRSLAAQELPAGVGMRVVVVDNDAAGSARPVAEEWADRIPGGLRYVVEPVRGITYARNRGVREAGEVDWVAFVDDDEWAEPTWLAHLLRTARDHDADVVTATVLPVFDEPPPAWVLRGGFFDRRRYPTGTLLPYARTSNALVAGRLLRDGGPGGGAPPGSGPFSERLALSGGEDTHFFQRVRITGGRMVWADDAVVREAVPATRVGVRWLVRREFRRGTTLSVCLRELEDSPRRRAKRVVAAAVHTAAGLGTVLTGVRRGRAAVVQGVQRVAFAGGLLVGLTGRTVQEYAVIHGR